MRILVTFAVEAEFAPWRKLRNLESRRVDVIEIFQAKIGRATVDFVVTGMGIQNAGRITETAMREKYDHCLCAGFAGALSESLRVGEIVAPRAVQHLGKSKTIESSRNLCSAARENQATDAKMLLTADSVISSVDEKRRLSPFAEIVDMESFAVLSVAKSQNVSAAAIRVITDRLDEDMPVDIATTVDDKGQVKIGGVVRYVARHPFQLPALIRLGKKSRTAAEALANFLEAFIKDLSLRTHGWPPPELQEVASR
jgi:adenosylhomocysteine nucleosidase